MLFRSANYTVKPLLTYYGVASLSRSLILLLNRNSGEESLTRGHGLETNEWIENLTNNRNITHESFLNLKVVPCSGLYKELISISKNWMCMHVSSSGVDWRVKYNVSNDNTTIFLRDVLSRFPDLQKDYELLGKDLLYSNIIDIKYNTNDGFNIKVAKNNFENIRTFYENIGYDVVENEENYILKTNNDNIEDKFPMFIHSYVQKMAGLIPRLFITKPFNEKSYISQLSMTYLLSYYLGMLVRYFPTQWISLIQGEKGDMLYPTINRAQHLVEETFPELVIEMIHDILENSNDLR